MVLDEVYVQRCSHKTITAAPDPVKGGTWLESHTFKFAFHTRGTRCGLQPCSAAHTEPQRGCVQMVKWTDDVSMTSFGAIPDSTWTQRVADVRPRIIHVTRPARCQSLRGGDRGYYGISRDHI